MPTTNDPQLDALVADVAAKQAVISKATDVALQAQAAALAATNAATNATLALRQAQIDLSTSEKAVLTHLVPGLQFQASI